MIYIKHCVIGVKAIKNKEFVENNVKKRIMCLRCVLDNNEG